MTPCTRYQVTPLKVPPTPIELRTVPFDKEITVFWVCEELKTPEYSGWYEVESVPPTFTMVVTRQQARFKRLTNGKKYTFKVTAVNQVGKSSSEMSAPCRPEEDISREQYSLKKKRIACKMKEILLELRKQQKIDRISKQARIQKEKTRTQRDRDKIRDKEQYNKILKHEQKKKRAAEKRKRKKEKEQEEKRKKMEEQRQRVCRVYLWWICLVNFEIYSKM